MPERESVVSSAMIIRLIDADSRIARASSAWRTRPVHLAAPARGR